LNLSSFLAVIAAHKRLVAAIVAANLVVALVMVWFVVTPKYAATTTLRVATRTSLSSDVVRSDDVTYLDRLQNTYASLAQSRPLIERLAREQRLTARPEVELRPVPNTELMQLQVELPDSEAAARAANRLAELLIARIQQLASESLVRSDARSQKQMQKLRDEVVRDTARYSALRSFAGQNPRARSQLTQIGIGIELKRAALLEQQRQYEQDRLARQERSDAISVVESATTPTSRSSTNLKTALFLCGILGLVAGIGAAFLLERLHPMILDRAGVAETADVPLLGEIPTTNARGRLGIFEPGSSAEEATKSLRLRIAAATRERRSSALLVTSAAPGDGKSTIVANIAAAFARSGARVVVADADLRIPQLHAIFGVRNDLGLSNALAGDCAVRDAVVSTDIENLSVLPSGPPSATTSTLLSTRRIQAVNAELKQLFDIVFWDSPAVLGVADTLGLAPAADEVILVVRRFRTRRAELRKALDELAGVDVVPMGAILNSSQEQWARLYYHQRVAA
jgi:succinoglycan biosynthesis transport protein ExoP